jgi:hypothetical protein
MTNPAPMWNYLTSMEKHKKSLPVYIEKPFSETQVDILKNIINEKLSVKPNYFLLPGGQEEYRGDNWHDPKKVVHMSREMVEFDAPEEIEKTMDAHVFPLYDGDIRLCHYSYIDYDLRHGDDRYAPSLPPHIDNTETLVTFNYMLDGNIDWDIYIDGKKHQLKKGDAILFSAVNQIHWRPKRIWKPGEFVKILTFDYSPLTDWRFTGQDYPLDPIKFPEVLEEYLETVGTLPEMQKAWNRYNEEGLKDGIPVDKLGLIG